MDKLSKEGSQLQEGEEISVNFLRDLRSSTIDPIGTLFRGPHEHSTTVVFWLQTGFFGYSNGPYTLVLFSSQYG